MPSPGFASRACSAGQLLALTEAVSERNFGDAQELSSRFFDQVRAEATALSDAPMKLLLEGMVDRRDAVTAGFPAAPLEPAPS